MDILFSLRALALANLSSQPSTGVDGYDVFVVHHPCLPFVFGVLEREFSLKSFFFGIFDWWEQKMAPRNEIRISRRVQFYRE